MGSSHSDLKAFPEEARRDAASTWTSCNALEPEDRKPMKPSAPRHEIRCGGSGAYRVIYLATRPKRCMCCIVSKKTEKTSQHDIDLPRSVSKPYETCEEVSHEKAYSSEHGRPRALPGRSVFYDLGFDEAEAHVLEMRAELMAALREHIEKRAGRKARRLKTRHHHRGCRR